MARAFKKHDKDMEITFVGTRRGIESKILPKEGFPLKTIWSAGLLGKKGLARWLAWFKLPLGIVQSLGFLMSKRPHLVVGVGGYVSGPLVFSAWLLRIPILIQEQNAIPGVTNRWLGKISGQVAVSFAESKRFFPKGKTVETGNMIREEFCTPRVTAASQPGERFQILVVGGSQGAHAINRAMLDALDHLSGKKNLLHIIHQTGAEDFEWVQKQYGEKGFSAEVQPFIHGLAGQYSRVSLVICRAGASTVAEITACGKAAILIPFPHAAHNHQERNARILAEADAGEMILEKDLSGGRLAQSIARAMENPDRLREMGENSYRLGRRDATQKVLELCLQLMGTHPAGSRKNGDSGGKYALSCF